MIPTLPCPMSRAMNWPGKLWPSGKTYPAGKPATGSRFLLWADAEHARNADPEITRSANHQFQPGFTHWGSFAEYVAIGYADINIVRLPDELDYKIAAGLGCRFVTSFRAVVDQGKVSAGQWVGRARMREAWACRPS